VKGLGWVSTVLMIIVGVAVVVIAIRSIPDVRRYAKIRRM
jgi:hypothetical protein